jgi:hypothetical protein
MGQFDHHNNNNKHRRKHMPRRCGASRVDLGPFDHHNNSNICSTDVRICTFKVSLSINCIENIEKHDSKKL